MKRLKGFPKGIQTILVSQLEEKSFYMHHTLRGGKKIKVKCPLCEMGHKSIEYKKLERGNEMSEKERPEKLEEEHLMYLDDLRESGVTNMWGASSYLMDEYPELDKREAGRILGYWMQTFSERHGK